MWSDLAQYNKQTGNNVLAPLGIEFLSLKHGKGHVLWLHFAMKLDGANFLDIILHVCNIFAQQAAWFYSSHLFCANLV
jgi:hypothetical protein